MTRCSICKHQSVEAIDALIQSGRSLNAIAKAMTVGADSLQRHVRNGHVKVPASASVPMPVTPASGDIDPQEDFRQQLAALDAIQATSPSQQLAVLEARRRVVAEMAKAVTPKDAEGPAQRALKVTEAMFAVQNEVIDRHPEIRREVSEALRAWKARRDAAPSE